MGFTTAFLRSRDGQPKDFFSKFFPPRFRRGKNTSNRFFIESKLKLPKKSKTKKCGSKPPINAKRTEQNKYEDKANDTYLGCYIA